MVDGEAVRRPDLALERAHDAGGDGALEPERVADRHHRLADLDVVRVGESQRRERLRVDVDLQEREIGGGVGAHDRRLDGVLVREAELDLRRAVDDVEVRHDVAFLVDHEPGAERLLGLARLGVAEGIRSRLAGRRRCDLHDTRPAAAVDLRDVDRRRADLGLPGAARDRRRSDDRIGFVERTEEGCTAERRAASEECGGGKRGKRLGGGRHPVGTLDLGRAWAIEKLGGGHASVIGAAL